MVHACGAGGLPAVLVAPLRISSYADGARLYDFSVTQVSRSDKL